MSRWLIASVLSAVSCIWLWWAIPRLHPAMHLGLQVDRDQALKMGRSIASAHGVDVQGWNSYVRAETQTKHQDLKAMMPTDPLARAFPPGDVKITFVPPAKHETVALTLRPDGRLMGWDMPSLKHTAPSRPLTMHETVLKDLAGEDAANYKMTTEGVPGENGDEFAWERVESAPGMPEIRVEAFLKDGVASKVEQKFTVPDSVSQPARQAIVVRGVVGSVWFALLLAAVVISIVREGSANVGRSMKDRAAIFLALTIVPFFLLSTLVEWGDQVAGIPQAPGGVGAVLSAGFGGLFMGLMLYFVMVATVLNAHLHPARVRALRLLPTGAAFSRIVGTELLGGWLIAPLLASVPLVVSAILRVAADGGYSDENLLTRWPVLDAVGSAVGEQTITTLVLLGILIPLGCRLSRWKWLQWGTIAIGAALTCFVLFGPFSRSEIGNVAVTLASAALFLWAYWQFGVLAALTAHLAARLITTAGSLLTQPAAGLHAPGVGILAVFACGGVCALILAWKGPAATVQLYGESESTMEPRTRREELLAEFHVARSAQQQMLPARPPALPGYTVSASCDPAREVGGDLYDFIHLPDGRIGIGVADVSGKGVPAALYMTLTKGLLCAASQDSSSPQVILTSVNTHLREAARKKMFVTMALGVVDIAAKTMEHVRAGHNPTVWRRTDRRETVLLTPSGMALGMTGPALFAKTLAAETIQMEAGDALVFYSDGLTEAMNGSQEQFGDDRLVAAVERADGMNAEATRDSILSEVKEFLQGGQSQDDLTIAVLRVNETNGR